MRPGAIDGRPELAPGRLRGPRRTRRISGPFVATLLAALLAAGCAAPAGTGDPTTPPAANPTATPAATPTESPTPTPEPTASAGDAAVARLVALALNPASTYQIAISGRSRHSADVLPIDGTLQVAGADSRLVADFVFPEAGGESRIEIRTVAGEAWLRIDGEPFTALGEITQDEAPHPFGLVDDADDITILASDPDADGRFTVELEAMLIHPGFIPAINLSDEDVDRTKLTLLVDADGRPISGTWELRGKGRVSRQLQEIVIELELAFSGLGSDIVITAP